MFALEDQIKALFVRLYYKIILVIYISHVFYNLISYFFPAKVVFTILTTILLHNNEFFDFSNLRYLFINFLC